MSKPLISIILPAYNHAKIIKACILAILKQTYSPLEIIVVNDGSTDNTMEVLSKFGDKIIIINQNNQGSNLARNNGFFASSGEYLLFCDADVIMKPNMLARLEQALEKNPQASYAYCSFRFGWKKFYGIEFSPQRLKKKNFIHTGSLIRRKDFLGFDPHIRRLQDWDLWLTMLEHGHIGILVDELLYQVKISGKSRIGSSWLPSRVYSIPWEKFGFIPKKIKAYREAQQIIAQKHNLND